MVPCFWLLVTLLWTPCEHFTAESVLADKVRLGLADRIYFAFPILKEDYLSLGVTTIKPEWRNKYNIHNTDTTRPNGLKRTDLGEAGANPSPADLSVSGFSVRWQTWPSLSRCAASGGRTGSSSAGLISETRKKPAVLRQRWTRHYGLNPPNFNVGCKKIFGSLMKIHFIQNREN